MGFTQELNKLDYLIDKLKESKSQSGGSKSNDGDRFFKLVSVGGKPMEDGGRKGSFTRDSGARKHF